ncbi:hypothetical protein NDU88_002964 [Pleurodeles waltl]|uniref:Secreted protein n=1 Tax=Pleurodeles waltl TaxID=8319 RepID=A0AAV7VE54_PLEWA|nr:hypothetical protein NDU88_002964 [Pleurodeles waltl]
MHKWLRFGNLSHRYLGLRNGICTFYFAFCTVASNAETDLQAQNVHSNAVSEQTLPSVVDAGPEKKQHSGFQVSTKSVRCPEWVGNNKAK